jgi:hypothetical protein
MHVPIRISPSMHGGGGGSAEGAGADAGGPDAEAAGARAAEADAETVNDATGATDAEGTAGSRTGGAGTGAEAQATRNPCPERARASREMTRR